MPSSINPNIPQAGQSVEATPIRNQFRAARSDILAGQAALAAETARATAAETALGVALEAETLRATTREDEIEAAIPTVLADLSDVSDTPPADGQSLVWKAGTGQWTPAAPPSAVNAQTGTTYTMQESADGGLVTCTNALAVAVTLPQAGAGSQFRNGWSTTVMGLGAGTVTITPATSTINGAASVTVVGGMGGGRIVSDGTNYVWIPAQSLYYSANGALSNQNPLLPTAAVSGSARGNNAIDFQVGRNNASQVASGNAAVAYGYRVSVAGISSVGVGSIASASGNQSSAFGSSATASGDQAVAVGYNVHATTVATVAIGHTAVAIGNYSTAIGAGASVQTQAHRSIAFGQGVAGPFATDSFILACNTTTITGKNSIVLAPQRGDDRGNTGGFIWSPQNLGGSPSSTGRSQAESYMFIGSTSGATALRLTTDGAAADATNVGALGTFQALFFTVEFLVVNTVTGASWTFTLPQSLLRKDANNASTALYPNGSGVDAGPTTGAPPSLGANPTVAADTTFGGLNISFTPPVANGDLYYAVAMVRGHSTRWA